MLIGGLWHGASWNFVIWGGIQGIMLAAERLQGKDSAYRRLPAFMRIAVTFLITCISWVFFRADTLPQGLSYLKSMFGFSSPSFGSGAIAGAVYTPYHVVMFFVCILAVWAMPQAWNFTQKLPPMRAVACLGVFAVSVAFLWTQTVNPFLYFQF
jgi:alginate O-acetyltransferase complex protein AlgI